MLKNILNLNGAQSLNKAEQKEINGGGLIGVGGGICPPNAFTRIACNTVCNMGICIPDVDIPNCYKCEIDHN